jgi:hypothetical protein
MSFRIVTLIAAPPIVIAVLIYAVLTSSGSEERFETLALNAGIVRGGLLSINTNESSDETLSQLEYPIKYQRVLFDPGGTVGPKTISKLKDRGSFDELILGTGVSDRALIAATELTTLKSLMVIENSTCTNVGMKNIGRLNQLRSLWITGYAMNDDAFANIDKCENLEIISTRANLTDVAMEKLSKLSNLRRLYIASAHAKTPGIALLGKLANLEEFVLGSCETDDEAFAKAILGMPKLRLLELRAYGVGDAGVAKVVSNSKLQRLHLFSPSLQIQTLDALKKARHLKEFSSYTPFFERHVDELKAARPDLRFIPYDGQ